MLAPGAPLMAGRRALISGGANGLGAATARLFAAHGAAVVVADLASTAERAAAVVDDIERAGGRAWFAAVDVRDAASVADTVARADELMGGIDAVVASAGVGGHPDNPLRHNELLGIDPAHFDYVLDVNLRGVFLLCQQAARRMVASKTPGAMVALASMAAKRPTAGAYSVSKAAVWMLARCLAQELGAHGIRVNAVGPGYVDTELFQSIVRAGAGPDPAAQEAFREARRAQIALGAFPTAQDVAQTILFLCSDAGRAFTGAIVHPDGGYTSTFGGG